MTYTINPNAENVWIRDNEDTMDLSPITDASSVYLENGRTLEQELGEGSMVSNVATVNESMSKVIDGTLDGAYESCVLKGRTLVNADSYHSKSDFAMHNIDTISDDGYIKLTANGTWRNSFTRFNGLLKPSTKYLAIVDVKTNTLSTNGINPFRLFTEGTSASGAVNVPFIGQTKVIQSGVTGVFKYILTTMNDLSNCEVNSRNYVSNSVESGVLEYRYVLIEYQQGMENWDIPYFEGICDVKMPILRNVGKNLFDMSMVETNSRTHSQWNTVISENSIRSTRWGDATNGEFGAFIRIDNVKPSTTYTLTYEPYINNVYSNVYTYIYNNSTIWGESLTAGRNGTIKFTTKSNTEYITIGLNYGICSLNTVYETRNIQLEESPTSTTYEPHKTNILHTPEIVTLRSLPNGVRDELNLKTGEYIKRIGEIVFDGSEDWKAWESNDTHCKLSLANYPSNMRLNGQHTTRLVCDKLKIGSDRVGVVNDNFMASVGDAAYTIIVGLELGKLTSANVAGFKQWLKENPLTVQYELATPITTKVTLTQSEPIVKIGTELPNGVCDTYNLLTGEHIQRVGKVVLDGSEVWKRDASSTKPTDLERFATSRPDMVDSPYNTGNLVVSPSSYHIKNNDSTPRQLPNVWNYYQANIYMDFATNAFGMTTSDTADAKITKLKSYLQSNPVTVWYELKNPIVTKKNGLPNTHGVTLPSGVVDKYNESTGEYTQNLGKVVLDGSQDLGMVAPSDSATYFVYHTETGINEGTTGNFIFNTFNDSTEIKTIIGRPNSTGFNITFVDQTINTVDKAKNCLASNPVEIYYPLATPKTIDIPLINVGQVLPNGVCDTYNPITKEYVKRVSGTVLVGNEDWSLMNSPYETDCIGFVTPCSLANWTQSQANLNIVCEGYVGNYELWNVDEEGFSVFKTPTRLAIKVKRSKLSTADINGFKKFLKLNPLAVWYELATPEVSTVDLDLSTLYSSSPIAYENGHIILESSHDGQSLLPTLEYSTITNRVKQIESIGEQVLRQEKQLTMLEQMLIQGIIGMDYNNILLTLNLEIDEVM